MTTQVAVAIVGYRNTADIVACLSALSLSSHTNFEVVICENGGVESHERLLAALPARLPGGQHVTIILANGNLGFAGGVNVCLSHRPEADAWWILNPDTQPHPEALAAKVLRLARGDCDGVGCTLYGPDGIVQARGGLWRFWLARAIAIGHGERLDARVDAVALERRQNFLIGAAMLVSNRFVRVAGLMPEHYFLYCEEADWCIRAGRKGLKLGFAPDARVMHAHGTTTGAADDICRRPRMPIYLDERNKMLLTRDLFGPSLPIAAPAAFALLFLRYARRGAWKQLGYGLSGWWAGLLGSRGKPPWTGDGASGSQMA